MGFEAVLAQWENREMCQAAAGRVLGVTERTFRRWCQRYEEDGSDGLLDRRLGKPSPKRVPPERGARVAELYIEHYQDFNAKRFHEHLVAECNFPWSYTWTKTLLHRRQLLPVAASTGVHRKKRPRRRRLVVRRPSEHDPPLRFRLHHLDRERAGEVVKIPIDGRPGFEASLGAAGREVARQFVGGRRRPRTPRPRAWRYAPPP